jgi:hypothetical protein
LPLRHRRMTLALAAARTTATNMIVSVGRTRTRQSTNLAGFGRRASAHARLRTPTSACDFESVGCLVHHPHSSPGHGALPVVSVPTLFRWLPDRGHAQGSKQDRGRRRARSSEWLVSGFAGADRRHGAIRAVSGALWKTPTFARGSTTLDFLPAQLFIAVRFGDRSADASDVTG